MTVSAMSPEIFRKWAGISLVAGAAERRLWSRTPRGAVFPNMFVMLVGAPGAGKSIIDDVKELWRETPEPGVKKPAFHVNPDNMTKASLLDVLARSSKSYLPRSGPPFNYNSLLVAAEEFMVFLPVYEGEFISTITRLWTNPTEFAESRRTGNIKELKIERPTLNILGGGQPSYLASVFPENAWNAGLTRRMIMVYSGDHRLYDVFALEPMDPAKRAGMISRLSAIAGAYGEIPYSAEAVEIYRRWGAGGSLPVPTHSKLADYAHPNNRGLLVLKLALISAISGQRKEIAKYDIERALGWLIEAEKLMPDIFRAMIGKSDRAVLEEFRLFMADFITRGGRPVPEPIMWRFLLDRMPHEKVHQLLQAAERSRMIELVAEANGERLWGINPKYIMQGE